MNNKKITKFAEIPINSLVTTREGGKYICMSIDESNIKVLSPIHVHSEVLISYIDEEFPKHQTNEIHDIMKIEYRPTGEILFEYKERKKLSKVDRFDMLYELLNSSGEEHKLITCIIDGREHSYCNEIKCEDCVNSDNNEGCSRVLLYPDMISIRKIINAEKIEVEE